MSEQHDLILGEAFFDAWDCQADVTEGGLDRVSLRSDQHREVQQTHLLRLAQVSAEGLGQSVQHWHARVVMAISCQ